MWPREEAIDFFTQRGEPLKVQLIEEKTAGQSHVSVYTIKDTRHVRRLLRRPACAPTGKLKAFKLLDDVQRVLEGRREERADAARLRHGVLLAERARRALMRLEEAKKRDHRKLGKELGLFTFHPWAPGADVLARQGHDALQHARRLHAWQALPRRLLGGEDAIVFNKELWDTSGHWEHYRENMFLVESADGEEMGLKAMNCPGHFLLFGSEMHSYERLPHPLPRADAAPPQRSVGRAVGLTRVRQFSQDDGHCFVTEEQIAQRGRGAAPADPARLRRLRPEYTAKLSTRPEKFLGEVATWDHAEAALKQALERAGQAYTINAGDGAFYGPKIDFDITDALGRKWQCATIQLDYDDAAALRPEIRRAPTTPSIGRW